MVGDVCLWQNMGYPGHLTQGTQNTNRRHRQRQEGDSRGHQTRTVLLGDGAWMSDRASSSRFISLFALFSFLGFGHFFL